MNELNINTEFIKHLMDNIGLLLGEKCELVLHDFRNGMNSTVTHIVNDHNSGRTVGSPPSSLLFDYIHELDAREKDFSSFFNTSEKGKIIKSSATYIRDEDGAIVGSLCINIDMTELVNAQCSIKNYTGYSPTLSKNEGIASNSFKEHFIDNVDELFDYYLTEAELIIGKHASLMTREEKEKAIRYLSERGLFKITNASSKLCDYFGISKYTLYNYLNNTESDKGSDKKVKSQQFM